jgi:dihydroneopterin aldolase
MAEGVRFTTILDGLELVMGLGIHAEELAGPQRVIVNVRMEVDYPAPPSDDRIEQVLDYDFIREDIRALVAGRHFHLQETLCEAIAALCLADARVVCVTVRSMKPDIYPDAAVGCEIVRSRGAAAQ